MSMYADLVHAKIEQARARGDFDRAPLSDEARLLAEMEGLLARLWTAEGRDKEEVRERLRACERRLGDVLERTGQAILADVLWDDTPSYDGLEY
ncbi:MAG: hypothetical protein K8H88_25725 [Sandaracinaceae bacterium]|nr:hypothetical protein [Sandaracinaceae bacterium]